MAEIFYHEPESAKLVARCMRTGKVLWSTSSIDRHWRHGQKISPPGRAHLKKKFTCFSQDPNTILSCVCTGEHAACEGRRQNSLFLTNLRFQCQTELYSFHPTSGEIRWSAVQNGLRLNALEWKDFVGLWTNDGQAGWLDLDCGKVSLMEMPGSCFGMPTVGGEFGYFPWFDKKTKSVGYLRTTQRMEVDCEFTWKQKAVRDIRAWPSSSGSHYKSTTKKSYGQMGAIAFGNKELNPTYIVYLRLTIAISS